MHVVHLRGYASVLSLRIKLHILMETGTRGGTVHGDRPGLISISHASGRSCPVGGKSHPRHLVGPRSSSPRGGHYSLHVMPIVIRILYLPDSGTCSFSSFDYIIRIITFDNGLESLEAVGGGGEKMYKT